MFSDLQSGGLREISTTFSDLGSEVMEAGIKNMRRKLLRGGVLSDGDEVCMTSSVLNISNVKGLCGNQKQIPSVLEQGR